MKQLKLQFLKKWSSKEDLTVEDIHTFKYPIKLFSNKLKSFSSIVGLLFKYKEYLEGNIYGIYKGGYNGELIQTNLKQEQGVTLTNAATLTALVKKEKATIKIEEIDKILLTTDIFYQKFCKYFPYPIDCHLFYSSKESLSFPFHKDPYPVVIYCLNGKKEFQLKINEQIYTYNLKPGDWLLIPKNFTHKARTLKDHTIILSFGVRYGQKMET